MGLALLMSGQVVLTVRLLLLPENTGRMLTLAGSALINVAWIILLVAAGKSLTAVGFEGGARLALDRGSPCFHGAVSFIKRIVGMPDDRIRIAAKVLFRNRVEVKEPYAVHKMEYMDAYRDNFPSEPNTLIYPPAQAMLEQNVVNGEVIVPAGKYFVLGDNRDQSLDSRYRGFR